MTLYYTIVFAILIAEIFTFFLLMLPISTRLKKPVFRWLATSPTVAHASYILKIVFGFIFVLFIDSVNTLRAFYEVVHEEENVTPGTSDFRAQVNQAAKKFYAQRNLYLTGFTMLLLLILNNIKTMNLEYIRLEDECLELRAALSNDPDVKRAVREMDTEPIKDRVTKLEPVEQPEENRKDI
ncbi:hypothetical protein RMATCC62417_02845 [Rhizopus microsporus]|nr:hypothetical protein RMATCC62417_02845 [Rhizopus microsporus]CEJ00542.1 hypothetical protein RMCBS344292_14595 [Rhizopus microsporus]